MKKFIVHTRPLSGYKQTDNVPSILQIDGEIIKGVEDPSVLFLPEGEYKFRIMEPKILYESREISNLDKTIEKIMVPPVYYSHSIYWTVHQAAVAAQKIVYEGFVFVKRKSGIDFTMTQVKEKCKEIQEIYL